MKTETSVLKNSFKKGDDVKKNETRIASKNAQDIITRLST